MAGINELAADIRARVHALHCDVIQLRLAVLGAELTIDSRMAAEGEVAVLAQLLGSWLEREHDLFVDAARDRRDQSYAAEVRVS